MYTPGLQAASSLLSTMPFVSGVCEQVMAMMSALAAMVCRSCQVPVPCSCCCRTASVGCWPQGLRRTHSRVQPKGCSLHAEACNVAAMRQLALVLGWLPASGTAHDMLRELAKGLQSALQQHPGVLQQGFTTRPYDPCTPPNSCHGKPKCCALGSPCMPATDKEAAVSAITLACLPLLHLNGQHTDDPLANGWARACPCPCSAQHAQHPREPGEPDGGLGCGSLMLLHKLRRGAAAALQQSKPNSISMHSAERCSQRCAASQRRPPFSRASGQCCWISRCSHQQMQCCSHPHAEVEWPPAAQCRALQPATGSSKVLPTWV